MMYIINTVDDYQYVYINYMEYDILRNQMMKPTPLRMKRHAPNFSYNQYLLKEVSPRFDLHVKFVQAHKKLEGGTRS